MLPNINSRFNHDDFIAPLFLLPCWRLALDLVVLFLAGAFLPVVCLLLDAVFTALDFFLADGAVDLAADVFFAATFFAVALGALDFFVTLFLATCDDCFLAVVLRALAAFFPSAILNYF